MERFRLPAKYRILLSSIANNISVLIVVTAFIMLALTLIFPVGPTSNPFEVYTRNFSTIACLFTLSIFFKRWAAINKNISGNSKKEISMFRIITLIVAFASMIKAISSFAFALQYLQGNNLVCLYYIGETAIWAACTIFFFIYGIRLKTTR